jgi:hypothetical protein
MGCFAKSSDAEWLHSVYLHTSASSVRAAAYDDDDDDNDDDDNDDDDDNCKGITLAPFALCL